MKDEPQKGRWRGLITRHNAKRKTEREHEGGGEITQQVIVLGFVCALGAALMLFAPTIQNVIEDAGKKTTSTFAEMTGGTTGGGGGGAVEAPDDEPIETVGTLSKSKFQTYTSANQNATELTFAAVSTDGVAFTDVSEEGDGSVVAFMDGNTMHVTAANGGKVGMPADCSKLFTSVRSSYLPNTTIIDMSNCNTSNVTDMKSMFINCNSLTEIKGIEEWDTSSLKDLRYMFEGCESLQSLDLSSWDTSNVTNMHEIFMYCESLTSLDLSGWDTSNVTDMSYMFDLCTSLTEIKGIEKWNTSNVTDIGWMFYTCKSLQSLDLSGWDTSNVANMAQMFDSCTSLTEIKVGDSWNTSNADTIDMFYDCGTDHVTHV